MLEGRKVKIHGEKSFKLLLMKVVHHIESRYTRTLDDEYTKIKETLQSVHQRGQQRAMPTGFSYLGVDTHYEADEQQ